jgi:hypothetical protein
MRLGKFKQAPLETRRYFVDYSEWLDTGEILIAPLVVNVVETTTPPLVISSEVISSDNLGVVFYVSGGLDGEQYQVDVIVTTSLGQVKEDNFTYNIISPD